jgi:hypothetical protein
MWRAHDKQRIVWALKREKYQGMGSPIKGLALQCAQIERGSENCHTEEKKINKSKLLLGVKLRAKHGIKLV